MPKSPAFPAHSDAERSLQIRRMQDYLASDISVDLDNYASCIIAELEAAGCKVVPPYNAQKSLSGVIVHWATGHMDKPE